MNANTETIRKIIARVAMIPEQEISETSVVNDLGVSSFDLIECYLALEAAFQVELPRDVIGSARTVGDFGRAIEDALASSGRAEKT